MQGIIMIIHPFSRDFQEFTFNILLQTSVVPQIVAKIAIGNCPMASGDCLIVLITKLVKLGGV